MDEKKRPFWSEKKTVRKNEEEVTNFKVRTKGSIK